MVVSLAFVCLGARTKANTEEIKENAYDGQGWDGEDDAEEARDLAPGDYDQEDQDRGDPQGLALNPGRQEVAF